MGDMVTMIGGALTGLLAFWSMFVILPRRKDGESERHAQEAWARHANTVCLRLIAFGSLHMLSWLFELVSGEATVYNELLAFVILLLLVGLSAIQAHMHGQHWRKPQRNDRQVYKEAKVLALVLSFAVAARLSLSPELADFVSSAYVTAVIFAVFYYGLVYHDSYQGFGGMASFVTQFTRHLRVDPSSTVSTMPPTEIKSQ